MQPLRRFSAKTPTHVSKAPEFEWPPCSPCGVRAEKVPEFSALPNIGKRFPAFRMTRARDGTGLS